MTDELLSFTAYYFYLFTYYSSKPREYANYWDKSNIKHEIKSKINIFYLYAEIKSRETKTKYNNVKYFLTT